jgi:hypothetical protein
MLNLSANAASAKFPGVPVLKMLIIEHFRNLLIKSNEIRLLEYKHALSTMPDDFKGTITRKT